MALDAYTAGKTAQQIVNECERLARYPKLNLDPSTGDEPVAGALRNSTAYSWLLDDLKLCYTLFDWPGTQKATTIQITARSQSLPTDFWRMQYENGLILLDDSKRIPLTNCTREAFFAGMTDDDVRQIPSKFYIDRTRAGTLFVDPITDRTRLAELHYYSIKTINDIEDVPDFPYDAYLTLCLLEHYYLDQDDARIGMVNQQKSLMMTEIRGTAFDNREQDSAGGLDNRFFKTMPWEYE